MGRGVRRMQGLERLTSLRKASFARNQISHIQGLDACPALQELSFEARDLALTLLLECIINNQSPDSPHPRLSRAPLEQC